MNASTQLGRKVSVYRLTNGECLEAHEALDRAFDGTLGWTCELVAMALQTGAETLRGMKIAGLFPKEYGCGWPDVVRQYALAYGWDELTEALRPAAPRPVDIDRMDTVLQWLLDAGLTLEQRRLVWAKASLDVSFADLGRHYGCTRQNAQKHYAKAMRNILCVAEKNIQNRVDRVDRIDA